MATSALSGSRYIPENPPDPTDPQFQQKLVEYLKREYGRIADVVKGSNVFNFEQQYVSLDKPQEGDVLYADGTSWNPGGGQGMYLFRNGVWKALSSFLPVASNPTPTADGEAWWDSDDNLIVVGDGTNTRRLSNWELIGISTPSNVADVQFTNLSAFRTLRFAMYMKPATDATNTLLRTSTNNGSSYDSAANDYHWQYVYASGIATPAVSTSTISTAMFFNAGNVGNAANEGSFGHGLIFNFNQAEYARALYHYGNLNSAGTMDSGVIFAARAQTTARNAIQFSHTAGNIASGYIVLEGLRG